MIIIVIISNTNLEVYYCSQKHVDRQRVRAAKAIVSLSRCLWINCKHKDGKRTRPCQRRSLLPYVSLFVFWEGSRDKHMHISGAAAAKTVLGWTWTTRAQICAVIGVEQTPSARNLHNSPTPLSHLYVLGEQRVTQTFSLSKRRGIVPAISWVPACLPVTPKQLIQS